jgi:hypothetical protein
MIINFRVREISRGTHKVVQTSILIKKKVYMHVNKNHNYMNVFS